MPPRQERSSAGPDEIAELRDEVGDLKNHVRALVDAIDAIREELQYLNINGIQTREPSPVPVLKRMAADPCAEDWNERLVIVRGNRDSENGPAGDSRDESELTNHTLPNVSLAKHPSGKLFAEPGEQATLF